MNSTSRGTSPHNPVHLRDFLRIRAGGKTPPPGSDVVLVWEPGQIGDCVGQVLTVANSRQSTSSMEALGAQGDPVDR